MEYRYKDNEKGDLVLKFDPDRFYRYEREKTDVETFRLGLHHAFGPHSEIITSWIYLDMDFDLDVTSDYEVKNYQHAYIAELRYLLRYERYNLTSGVGYFDSDLTEITTWSSFPSVLAELNKRHTNLYLYGSFALPKNLTWTFGGSYDIFQGDNLEKDEKQFNPKLGLSWNPFSDTTVRAAAFRTFKRSLISNQTLEPTNIAGFNQFFDDGDYADVWRYGVGIDHKFHATLYMGAEASKRELEEIGQGPPPFLEVESYDSEEQLYRAYLYWMPYHWMAFGPEYQLERFKNPLEFAKNDIIELRTHRFSLGMNFFHPSGFSARIKPTYVNLNGKFIGIPSGPPPPFFLEVPGESRFWIVDASISYRLPKRAGLVTIEAKNLFDRNFRFQEMNCKNPTLYPERLILAKCIFSF
jgi:outer membrane receptor protein involved in Fe transport